MVPVVQGGFWPAELVALLVGVMALARTRSRGTALNLMFASAAVAWLVAFGVYWLVSFRLVGTAPPPSRP